MTSWIRRNRWAFPVIVVAVALIAATVTYPAWSRKTAPERPVQTVALGQTADVYGAQWRMSAVTIPPLDEPGFIPEDAPADSTLVAYVIDRKRDGAPSGLPPGFEYCITSMVDGPRRWTMNATSSRIYDFKQAGGLASICMDDGPLLVAMYVPEDAEITAVDVLLQPGDNASSDEESEDTETSADEPAFTTYAEPPVVVRFSTS